MMGGDAQSAETGAIRPVPFAVIFDNERDLYEFLARLNEDGHHPELPTMDSNGIGFLATLTDPDADHVHHVVTDESGRAHACDGTCDVYWAPCAWRPVYPVLALSWQDPAVVRHLIAEAQREQDARDDARHTAALAEVCTPPGPVQS